MTSLLNPFARGPTGELIDIDQWTAGVLVTCPGCNGPMVGRKGSRKRHHFSHVAGTSACSGETALHAVAKELIRDGFLAARAAGRPYEVRWDCPGCREPRAADATRLATMVELERTLVDGVRSDVVFRGGRRDFVAEVVVTHALEPETAERYTAARSPVFVVVPFWDGLRALRLGFAASTTLNVGIERCPRCRSSAQRRARIDEQVRQVREELEARPPAGRRVRPWHLDKFGHVLLPSKAAVLVATGERLISLGFQQTQKPWLFVLTLPGGIGTMFANMGGTEEVPIWEDLRPLLHWTLRCDEELKSALVHGLLRCFSSKGVVMRVSHYERLRGVDDDLPPQADDSA
jgi:ssDNA-binding Zn-finger/Zn-ribbon topoisomerase 1